jgi:hypothetical protein
MWKKKGLLFNVSKYYGANIVSHASIPFAFHLNADLYRIYFSARNQKGNSLPYYIDATISKGLIKLNEKVEGPFMLLGDLGTFDDSGIMPSCVVTYNDQVFMYYIGWNPQVSVSYRLSIGLAISNDNGLTFSRYSKGPISDRGADEPFFNTAPYVIIENGIWRMWYISCTEWKIINSYPEPKYHVKYCESNDGINWTKKGIVCIDYDDNAEAIGRPCILFENGIYKMYYSYRKIQDYRTNSRNSYKIGYAESADGVSWEKMNGLVGIKQSESINDWDSEMMEYCHVFNHQGQKYMLYNGNGFGKFGFGYAII